MKVTTYLMSFLYSIGLWIAFPGIWVASLFSKKIRTFLNGRIGLVRKIEKTFADVKDDVVWFHCSSVGEFEQARPLIEWYKGSRPQTRILLTFFSPSGYELRKNYSLADWVFYLPLDTIPNARRLVKAIKPKKLIFTKYDLWNNLIRRARKAGCEIYLISAIFRSFQPFFKWWGGFFRRMLKCITVIFVQDEESKNLLSTIGIKDNVIVSGDTRFDRVEKIASESKHFPVIENFAKDCFTIVAGSTWQPDDELIAQVMKNFSKVRLVVAPHEIHKERIEKLLQIYEPYGTVRYSEVEEDADREMVSENPQSIAEGKRVLVIDCIGILSSLYRYADFAYIGGGFGVGIHNTLEAAVYGVPLAFGPNYRKFQEAIDLIECNGATSVSSASELYQVIDNCVKDKELRDFRGRSCRNYVEKMLGATEKIISVLEK
ncbi:MAG: 3-deoxy-D-manno-octulosonic acid transferase [Bacteroidales bacterium]|nr:3-deoxy-D-manno-octulosonic acid transferase [Bacteroidales bacterium]